MNAQVVALVNQKGGVGKSTTCVNLGVGLAQAGKKVLLIDCDPQASLSISLGHSKPDTLPVTLSDMMGKVLNDQPIAPGEGILHHAEGIDLMPSNIQLCRRQNAPKKKSAMAMLRFHERAAVPPKSNTPHKKEDVR